MNHNEQHLEMVEQQEPPCKTGSQCVGNKCERCAVKPEQEPVAWYDAEKDCAYTLSDCEGRAQDDLEPLYLAPPSNPWQGLTDEEIWESDSYKVAITDQETRWLYRFAKEIEAKLKEKNT